MTIEDIRSRPLSEQIQVFLRSNKMCLRDHTGIKESMTNKAKKRKLKMSKKKAYNHGPTICWLSGTSSYHKS